MYQLTTIFHLISLLFICYACSQAKESTEIADSSQKPNIIFILADDMGYGDPGCYNAHSKIPTPNIDCIAENGVRLTDAHAPGPWCVPSRYGLMTGQYPARIQLNWQQRALINPQQYTIATLLQQQDYYTAMIGKWHLGFDGVNWDSINCEQPLRGGPVDHGFDYFFGMHASLDIPPYFYIENDHCLSAPTDSIAEHQIEDATTSISGAFWRAGKIAPDFKHAEVLPAFTDKATSFLEQHHQNHSEQPFFLYLALAAPHTPWLPTAAFQDKSQAGEYGDFVVQVDHTVGEVMKTVRALGIEEQTLVIFTSDNGPVWFEEDVEKYDHRSTDVLRGMKIDKWEGGHRIPFVAQWPGKIPNNTVRNDLFCFTDMMAIFAAVVGDTLPKGAGQDSYNMLPVLMDQHLKQPIRNELLIGDQIMRQGKWKLIQGSGQGGLSRTFGKDIIKDNENVLAELYNLEEDISESNNLYEQYPKQVKKLTKELQKYNHDY